ncbi:MAG: alpha/beta fold hydrolase, partial [Mycobacteriales bacterium]
MAQQLKSGTSAVKHIRRTSRRLLLANPLPVTVGLALAAGLFSSSALMGTMPANAASASPTVNTVGRPTWAACPDVKGAQCTTLQVPVDWSQPRGATLGLRIAKVSASDPSARIGTLVWLPGGPGDSGLDALAGGGTGVFSSTVRQHFDLVSFDPRGTGRSQSLNCAAVVRSDDLVPHDQASLDKLAALRASRWKDCFASSHGLAQHMDSASNTRDVDAIRTALGENKISLVGVSYGTLTGQAYAELFANRLRSAVFSSVVDHTRSQREQTVDDSHNIESLFDYYASWLATDPQSALHGRDARTLLLSLLHQADVTPISSPHAATTVPVSGDDIRNLVVEASDTEADWPTVSTLLVQANDKPDASGIRDR